MSAHQLITDHLDLWTQAVTKKSTAGRGNNGKVELTGIKKLRELILELAVRGKLVEQDPDDEPANVLLEQVANEKAQLAKVGKIKKSKKLPDIDEEEKPFGLPDGWLWARMEAISEYIQRGKGPKYAETGGVRVVSQKCVQWSGFDLSVSRFVDDSSLDGYQDERYIRDGDVLWNSTGTGTVGRAIVIKKPQYSIVADSHVTIVRLLVAEPSYVLNYISSPSVQHRIEPGHENSLVSGTTKQVELNSSSVKLLPVPLPPLKEQHRIVQKVDELMVLCDRLEKHTSDQLDAHETLVDTLLGTLTQSTNATELADNWARLAVHFDTLFTTEQSIDKLKQTILQLAVMGRLVEQDARDEPASILLEKIAERKANTDLLDKTRTTKLLRNDFTSLSPLPHGWAWASIQSLLLGDTQNGLSKKADKNPEGVPLLRISAATTNQNYIVDESDFNLTSTVTEEQLSKYKLEPQDLLAVRFNGNRSFVGRTALFQGDRYDLVVYPDKLIRLRFPVDFVVPRLVSLFMNSRIMREEIEKYCATTVGNWGISAKNLKQVFIPLPPLEEQHRIVQKVDELMALCDQLKKRLSQSSETRCQLAEAVVGQGLSEGDRDAGF